MRKRTSDSGVTVNAIAGTHVVTLGLDLTATRRKRCLGFAIQREDRTEDERYWMRGMKTFAETDPALGPGGQASSREHPFQSFQWADYSAKPSHDYAYTVIPLYGTPRKLEEGPRATVEVSTEPELGRPHSVFFNRGSVATQEYARTFQEKAPSELSGEQQIAAYRWLSRGLEEAMIAFIQRADGADWGLHGAVFELRWPAVLAALKESARNGAEVSVLYHGVPGETASGNEQAISAAQIKGLCRPRTTGSLMHNKFFVLTRKGKPVAVWTGSTNVTESGIFGHMNCGHIIEDAEIAADYLAYWTELCENPTNKDEKKWMGEHNPRPPAENEELPAMTTVFSPHSGNSVLNWYRDVGAAAEDALMMSFAFGMDSRFKEVYSSEDDVLRFALMDKIAVGKAERVIEETAKIQKIRNRPNVVVAIGNRIVTNSFDRWLRELDKIIPNPMVPWVHTKFMLADPLSDSPTTITGSANWSEGSTSSNTENMVVIHGDTRVADIYLGEYMRLHSHYAFREALSWVKESDSKWQPQNLVPNPSWQDDHFDERNARYWKRRYFAG